MAKKHKELGRTVAVFGVAPAHLQRAAFVAVLSFLFFLGMLTMYSVRGNIGYFLLATAFLLIHLVVLYSWVTQRRRFVNIHTSGLTIQNDAVEWTEIESIDQLGIIRTKDGGQIEVPASVDRRSEVIDLVRDAVAK